MHLQCIPTDAKPVSMWTNRDEAFRDVAKSIRTAIEHLRPCLSPSPTAQQNASFQSPVSASAQPQNTPSGYHSCVLSYVTEDQPFAEKLYVDFQSKGFSCWFAPHDLRIGDKMRDKIYEAIQGKDKLLLILSEHSVASDWVEHEVETALAKEHKEKRTILFPIRLDNAILEREHIGWPALVQHERHIGDFTRWKDHDQYQAALDRLLRDLKKADK